MPNVLHFLHFRLVINLMLLNIVSCLALFPSVVVDFALAPAAAEAISEEISSTNSSSISAPTASPPPMTAAASVFVCIWGTLTFSLISNGSILAMLAIGERD